MDVNSLALNSIKYEVVLDDQVSITQAREFFFSGYLAEVRMVSQNFNAFFDLCQHRLCRGRAIRSNERNDLRQIILRNPEESDGVPRLPRTHGGV